MIRVRDLQHRFRAGGRTYVVEVCAPGKSPAPVSAGPFDVHIMADVPAGFANSANDKPEKIVRHVVDFAKARTGLARLLLPFGRPFGLPDWPGLLPDEVFQSSFE